MKYFPTPNELDVLINEKKEWDANMDWILKYNPTDSKTIKILNARQRVIQNDIDAIKYSP